MLIRWVSLGLLLLATMAWGDHSQEELEQLRIKEETPAFRRAVIAYQIIRETYKNAYKLPSIQPLIEVMGRYGQLADSLAGKNHKVAAAALDRALQIGFILGEHDDILDELKEFEENYPNVVEQLQIMGNSPKDTVFGDGKVEVRALEIGKLEDEKIIAIRFETHSLSSQTERLCLDLRVINPTRNYQTSYFFEIPPDGWKQHEITLRAMFAFHDPSEWEDEYRVLPGDSVVRVTFGTVPAGYQEGVHSRVAFENQFFQGYFIRRPE